MSRIPFYYQGASSHPDIIQLLHDEVISLCKKNYADVSGLEIDGIICISILDTKEQQVVKIHQTVKSVIPDRTEAKRQKVTHPGGWLNGSADKLNLLAGRATLDENKYREDINVLNELLKQSNAALHENVGSNEATKKSKRKRHKPVQRHQLQTSDVKGPAENAGKSVADEAVSQGPPRFPVIESTLQGAPGVNPLIHKDVVRVKEETIDPEYSKAENVHQETTEAANIVNEENTVPKQGITDIVIDGIATDTEKQNEEKDSSRLNSVSQGSDFAVLKSKETSSESMDNDTESVYKDIEIKVEKIHDDGEYGVLSEPYPNKNPEKTSVDSDGNNTENDSEFVFQPVAGNNEPVSGGEGISEESELQCRLFGAHTKERKSKKEKAEVDGKTWMEMVKQNVNKYQAALARAVTKPNTEQTVREKLRASIASNSNKSLVALLQQPPAVTPKSVVSTSLDSVYDRTTRGSSLPLQSKETRSSRSTSVSPVVKIEVDEEEIHEEYSKSDGETAKSWGEKIGGSDTEITRDVTNRTGYSVDVHGTRCGDAESSLSSTQQMQQGRLESRYPALFSHLQRARQVSTDPSDQRESLVNRLPYISFQELFSQAATMNPTKKMSESITWQLLEKARVNPFPSRQQPKARRQWNWKKRAVRPKDAEGNIITTAPAETPDRDESLAACFGKRKPFSKRSKKVTNDTDKDWQPDADLAEVDSDTDITEFVPDTRGALTSTGRRTRLSCGEKPRINFAEIENSDIEMEEDDIEDLQNYGNDMQASSMGYRAYNEQTACSSSATASEYRCILCGLDFNQSYRWQYHMIKVHSIPPDKLLHLE